MKDKCAMPKEFTISSGQVPHKGSEPLPGFKPPSSESMFPKDTSGQNKEFEFPIGKSPRK
jgi:hypothetical protein